jgi:hypothetical protein
MLSPVTLTAIGVATLAIEQPQLQDRSRDWSTLPRTGRGHFGPHVILWGEEDALADIG